MNNFKLDSRLANDCIQLGQLDLSLLLLMNNALVPWFILAPKVAEQELFQLTQEQQLILLDEINRISRFVHSEFAPDKLNVAAIGNIVQQLHIHIVGRRRDDFCWPGVVWGAKQRLEYSPDEINRLRSLVASQLSDRFQGF
ncbi:MAG: HIT family protein [Pseudomonadota bacterium]